MAPSARVEFLTSTKLPMCTSAPSCAPGRSRAKGPMSDLSPTVTPAFSPSMWVKGWITAPASMRAFAMTQLGADAHALAQEHRAFEHAVDVDLDVGLASQRAAQVEPRRVGEPHALCHERLRLPQLPGTLERRQLRGAVDARHLERVGRDMRHHRHAVGGGQLDDVGEVVLALGIAVVQPGQPALEQAGGHGHHAAVDFADFALRLGRVLVLDDGHDLTAPLFRGADDAPVARGVVELDGQQREPLAGAGRQSARAAFPRR